MKKIKVVSIEENVPIPVRMSYPLKDMNVGDSFEFPLDKRNSVSARASKMDGKEFTIKKTGDNTCRVWRIS